jgi:hypothetical protein
MEPFPLFTDYWEFNDGIVLFRRTLTDTGFGFRLMSTGTSGQWRDDHAVGWQTHHSEARRLDVDEARELAERLGGSLEDDGGIVPLNKNGESKTHAHPLRAPAVGARGN